MLEKQPYMTPILTESLTWSLLHSCGSCDKSQVDYSSIPSGTFSPPPFLLRSCVFPLTSSPEVTYPSKTYTSPYCHFCSSIKTASVPTHLFQTSAHCTLCRCQNQNWQKKEGFFFFLFLSNLLKNARDIKTVFK